MAENGKTSEHVERIMEFPVEKLEHMNGFSMDFSKPLIIIMINIFTDQGQIQYFLGDGANRIYILVNVVDIFVIVVLMRNQKRGQVFYNMINMGEISLIL